MIDIGQRIKYFRTAKKFSVNKLANLAGISQSYLRELELGKYDNPSIDTITWITDALGISLVEFFDESHMEQLKEDPLLEQICHLSPKQRKALEFFLQSINEDA